MFRSTDKLKVVQITPTYFSDDSVAGGGERYVTNLCEALNRYAGGSISSEIVSFSEKKEGRLETDHVGISILRNEWNSSNAFEAANGKPFDLMEGADVIHIHQPFTGCGKVALLTAKQLRKVVVITDHGRFVQDSFSEWHGANLAEESRGANLLLAHGRATFHGSDVNPRRIQDSPAENQKSRFGLFITERDDVSFLAP